MRQLEAWLLESFVGAGLLSQILVQMVIVPKPLLSETVSLGSSIATPGKLHERLAIKRRENEPGPLQNLG